MGTEVCAAGPAAFRASVADSKNLSDELASLRQTDLDQAGCCVRDGFEKGSIDNLR